MQEGRFRNLRLRNHSEPLGNHGGQIASSAALDEFAPDHARGIPCYGMSQTDDLFLDLLRNPDCQFDELGGASQMIQTLAAGVSAGVVVVDRRGVVRLWNPAAERIFGWTQHELLALGEPPIFEEPGEWQALMTQMLHGRRIANLERTMQRKDGALIDVAVSALPLYDDGIVCGALVIYSDITERNRLQEQARQSLETETMGLIIGGIAHDFNNVLTVLSGLSGILAMSNAENDDRRIAVDGISQAVNQMASLVKMMSAFAGKNSVAVEPVDVNAVLEGMEKTIAHLLGQAIDLQVRRGVDIGLVQLAGGQLERVLLNLVLNARDAMTSHGRLRIETSAFEIRAWESPRFGELSPGQYVRLIISDTGCGMSAQTAARIFEPHFTTKGSGQGRGYGLSSVRRIIHGCGGEIFAKSEVGRGTTFTILLPRIANQEVLPLRFANGQTFLPE